MRAVSLPPGTQRFSRSSVLGEQRVGIVLAVIAALAAILLRHRRHHPPRQRLAFGELHALGKRHGRIVPGRAVVGFGGALSPAHRSDPGKSLATSAVDSGVTPPSSPNSAGEQAVEPGALLGRERRGLRDEGRDRRPRRDAHAAPPARPWP